MRSSHGRLFAILCSACAASCIGSTAASYQADARLLALAPTVVFQGSAGPLSYHSAVGRDGQRLVPKNRVRGRACQRGFQIPLLGIITAAGQSPEAGTPGALSAGWGAGGYHAAIDEVRRQLPAGAVLYDVQADLHHLAILSVYKEQCVVIDAGVLVPSADAQTARAPGGPPRSEPESAAQALRSVPGRTQ